MWTWLSGLTTRGTSFLAAGVAAVIAGYFLAERSLLCVGVALIALPIFTVVSARRARHRLSCTRIVSPRRVPAGSTAHVTLRLRNISRLPTGLMLAEDNIPYALGTRPRYVLDNIERSGSRELTYTLRSDLRGKFEVGPLQLRVADSFGLVEIVRSFSGRTTFVVTPKVYPLTRTMISRAWAGEGDGRSRLTATAGEDDVIPRAYRDGDDLRRVHWRSTARYGELMVRREEQRWRNRATVLLDTRTAGHVGSGPSSSFELAVSAAASVGVHLAQEGLTGQLITDQGISLGAGMMFEDMLLESLAVIKPSRGQDLSRGIQELRASSAGVIIAVLGRTSEAGAAQLAACRTEGSQAIAMLLAVGTWAESSRPAQDANGNGNGAARPAGPAAPAAPCRARRDRSDGGRPASGGLACDHDRRRHAAGCGLAAAAPRRRDARARGQLRRPRQGWADDMTNHRLTVTAAIAVVAASFSLYTLIKGNGWMAAAIGAVAMVALAGSLARLATIPAAVAATAAVLVAIVPPLAGQGWPGRIGALILLALVALSATGARPLRAFAALATYASFLLFYLNIAFAGGPSYGGVVPSASSVAALSRLPGQASPQFKYSPPILPTRPVEFFAAAGIGIVAILVDIIAVRMRRPALAGLPLLLLYSVPVATSLKGFGLYQSLTFAIAIAAYLALLSADGKQRLRMWGRLVTVRRMSRGDEAGSGPDTRALTASGRRVGLAAVCLALVVPVVLVGTTPHDLFKKNPDGSGTLGSSQSGELSPLLTVGQQLAEGNSPVLWYRTDAAEPNQQYLQAYVLNYYPSLNDWLPYNTHIARIRAHRLPLAVPGLAGGTPATVVHTSIVMRELREAPLPLPYAPVQVSDPGASLQEGTGTLMVFDPQTQTNVHFSVTSREAVPDKSLLSLPGNYPTSIHNAYGSYTGPDVRQLTQIAEAHIAKAQTPLQIAVDLQDWLSSFTYTTKPNIPAGRGWLLDFLTKDKRGDCEQFAPAMAVLARLVGIPARVAVGYTAGTPVGNGQWQVTTADAHAWPELYFPQVGWVRFEPTPGGVGQQATAIAPPYSVGKLPPVAPSNVGTNNGGQTKSSQHNSNGISKGKINGITGGRPGDVGKQAGSGFPIWIPIVVLVFLLLTWPALGRWLTRRRRWMAAAGDAAQAHAAWRELLDYLTDYGLTWLPSESPRAIARRIADAAKVTPEARAAVSRLATAQERASYSIAPQDGAGLHADVLAVRKALAANSTKRERMRARLLPPSTLAVAGTWVQAANQALSWIDSPLPNLRRRFRGTRHQTS